jgi:hypothetical protein
MPEETNGTLNSGNGYNLLFQDLLSSNLVSNRMFRNAFLLVNECETWSLILREEHRLRVSKNRVLRKLQEAGKNSLKS